MEATTTSFHSSPPQAVAATPIDGDAVSLDRLSTHLERLLDPEFPNRADTEIVLASGGSGCEPAAAIVVGAHSCILAARSPFFRQYFSSIPAGEKARLNLADNDMVPGGRHIGRDALMAVLGYLYSGRFKVPPQECVDDTCRHGACRPAIDFVVESTYAASGFQIPELVSLLQRRLSVIVGIAYDEDIIPIIRVASKCQLSHLLDQCIQRVATSRLDDNFFEKELPGDIYYNITFGRCLHIDELDASIVDAEHEKRVTNIHKALDSGNVDRVAMLLKQYGVTLDEALAIHYAAFYCEPKVLQELLKLDLDHSNVNMKNSGGYTPLHMACMRLEPYSILPLLEKGASVLEWTQDKRDALTICKRLTRHQKDINRELKNISKPYLCINILEEAKRTFTLDQVSLEEANVRVTTLCVDNFIMMLLDLESRVIFAERFFPSEAQLAMRIAEADSTEEFAGVKLKDVGLNEHLYWRLRERFDALTRTVKLGRRYFPTCSDVLDKFLTEESALANSTPEDQLRMHFYKLKKDVREAFNKDTAGAGLAEILLLLYRRGMLNLGTNPSQAEDAADSTNNAHAPPSSLSIQASSASTASRQLGSQSIDVAVDDDVGVGYKRKLKSPVWGEFKRVKTKDDCIAICKWCQKELKACSKIGTTHLHRHLNICQSREATKGLN